MSPTFDHLDGRERGVDILRGGAVVSMILYHFFYDLRFFFGGASGVHKTLWLLGHLVIAGTFFLTSGISAALSARGKMQFRTDARRIAKLAGGAGLVSLSTFIIFPDKWIYCGVLHSLTACAILGLYFRHRPRLCLLGGVGTGLVYATFEFNWPGAADERGTLDYVPIFPWVGVYLFGIWLWSLSKTRELLGILSPIEWLSWVGMVGRHSLAIYLIHQPILIGLLWVVFRLS